MSSKDRSKRELTFLYHERQWIRMHQIISWFKTNKTKSIYSYSMLVTLNFLATKCCGLQNLTWVKDVSDKLIHQDLLNSKTLPLTLEVISVEAGNIRQRATTTCLSFYYNLQQSSSAFHHFSSLLEPGHWARWIFFSLSWDSPSYILLLSSFCSLWRAFCGFIWVNLNRSQIKDSHRIKTENTRKR